MADDFEDKEQPMRTAEEMSSEKSSSDDSFAKDIKTPQEKEKEALSEAQKRENARIDKMKVFGRYPVRHLAMVTFGFMYPGNIYLMRYGRFKHDPYPLFFYIGFNPKYKTIEGVNLHYLPFPERKRTVDILRKIGYLRKIFRYTNPITKERMYYMKGPTNGYITYQRFKRVLPRNVIFYRRYKMQFSKPIYLVPYNHLDNILYIVSPMKKFTAKEWKNIRNGLSMLRHNAKRR